MSESGLRSGRVIGGKWVLDRLLGRGGMGEVWLATHQTLRQSVAIKILDRDAFPFEVADEARSRFDLEARLAAKLARKTRHIVTVVDNGRDEEVDYLVMELLEGESLEERLGDGPLDPMLVADAMSQAARGLAFAHAEGVIHRDLKPSNLYLTSDENGARLVKLLDFGIAKARPREGNDGPQSSHSTRAGVIIGTAQYMSPEQARGLAIDARVDVWALAAVAYELLTARVPHEATSDVELLMKICTESPPSPRVYRASLPVALDAVFTRAFAPSIDDRYQDARSFADALSTALRSSPSAGSLVAVVAEADEPPPPPPRSRRPMFIAAAAFVAVAIGGVAFVLRSPSAPEPRPAAQPSAPSPPAATATSSTTLESSAGAASSVAPPSPSTSPAKPHASAAPRAPKPAPSAQKKTDKSEIL